jgi:chromosomal replication initiation ATPase DnaA
MTQLTFDLPRGIALSRSDFLISDSNAAAIAWIDRWSDWPCRALALHGPGGCGKTHLVHLWCAQTAGVIVPGEALSVEMVARLVSERRHRVAIDDADRASELALLHLYNFCIESRGSLLVAARQPPAAWTVVLPDLDSRLRAALAIEIGLPDDALLGAVLVKHFADRQLRVAPEVIAYLLTHIERSFAAAAEMTSRLDVVSLRDRRAITVTLARQVVSEAGVSEAGVSEAGAHGSSSARDSGVT